MRPLVTDRGIEPDIQRLRASRPDLLDESAILVGKAGVEPTVYQSHGFIPQEDFLAVLTAHPLQSPLCILAHVG